MRAVRVRLYAGKVSIVDVPESELTSDEMEVLRRFSYPWDEDTSADYFLDRCALCPGLERVATAATPEQVHAVIAWLRQ